MNTVRFKGITLTVVPSPTSACSIRVNNVHFRCFLNNSDNGVCNKYCPDNNKSLPLKGQSHILLNELQLQDYLQTRLIGAAP